MEEIGVNLDVDEELIRYLGNKRALEVVESNNLVGEFCWITGVVGVE